MTSEERLLEQQSAPAAPPAKKKLGWLRLLRPVIGIGLLVFLLRGAKLSDFAAIAKEASVPFLGVALALVVVALVVSAYKWQRLLVVQKVNVPLPRLFASYLVGLFFNNFLPTNIGGDVVRIHDVASYTGKTAESVASVVSERLLAAFALALTAALGLALSYQASKEFGSLVGGLFVLTLGLILLLGSGTLRRAVGRKVKLPDVFSLRHRVGSVVASTSTCLQHPATVAWVLFYSIVFHLTVVLINYFIFLALGLNVPFVYCLLFIPIISAIQLLPISISGFGVREGAYVYFFGGVGLSSVEAIASSLIFWALVALISLAGGVIFALRR
ncbi:MAG: lysylphosphatidylglycerol synthase transmembrane domain-containing protein [Dehalococcoidia bacterium]|nr:lysylphosphatidylglycerol synthase transmembrane domain-containing protein [Dehalococcoidia bacterium]